MDVFVDKIGCVTEIPDLSSVSVHIEYSKCHWCKFHELGWAHDLDA